MAYKYPYNDEEEVQYKRAKFNENRSVWKFIILSILTFGLYSIFFFMPFSFELDKIASEKRWDKNHELCACISIGIAYRIHCDDGMALSHS